ncbi:HtaA domain-containing protein [Micromonospora radicis]|uniref:Htaa domain-containing protein n=1 Tax=Micromonospora radicis TaxID=1894971 RepID=A0A418MUJ1_9ACTN|nr:HtaA domain-containing protein [Micromonospora radicis]RIV37953.1 hypothetical protein D2L64_13450 [Micromonospora radicis]
MIVRPFTDRVDLGFAWSVKDSFLHYIRGMPDGRVEVSDGAAVTSAGEFYFPLVAVESSPGTLKLSFGGEVRFTAHRGLLSVALKRPRIDLHDAHAELFVRPDDLDRQVAAIELPPRILDGDVAMWLNSATVLAGDGPEMFGGTYPPGEPLAPLTVRVPVRPGVARRAQEAPVPAGIDNVG